MVILGPAAPQSNKSTQFLASSSDPLSPGCARLCQVSRIRGNAGAGDVVVDVLVYAIAGAAVAKAVAPWVNR